MSDNHTTIIYAVRHGETEWNLVGKQQGQLNSPLSDAGVKQARLLAEGLGGREIQVLYSSDLGRALETAGVIGAALGLETQVDPRLRERHLGSLQGLTWEAFRSRFPEEAARAESGDPDYACPGGESPRERHQRCVACCAELAARHPGGRILVVTHGGVVNSLFHHALGIELGQPRRFSNVNAAINSFSVTGDRWRLDTWGDISHMRGMTVLDDF
jgi:probable phosphoglycerate mutase